MYSSLIRCSARDDSQRIDIVYIYDGDVKDRRHGVIGVLDKRGKEKEDGKVRYVEIFSWGVMMFYIVSDGKVRYVEIFSWGVMMFYIVSDGKFWVQMQKDSTAQNLVWVARECDPPGRGERVQALSLTAHILCEALAVKAWVSNASK
ncbi:hypothetical protein RRG08_046053 [Elysia crispata]|uniref:Uncharacterized protein n=1 Tax=Elysia crispata TaxID=231223 RepID=A0AAE1A8M4_9GAST|nr:hypothetical protein RRG08_046053 [Elysia crispata]